MLVIALNRGRSHLKPSSSQRIVELGAIESAAAVDITNVKRVLQDVDELPQGAELEEVYAARIGGVEEFHCLFGTRASQMRPSPMPFAGQFHLRECGGIYLARSATIGSGEPFL